MLIFFNILSRRGWLRLSPFFSIFVVMNYLYIGIYLIVVWGWVGFEMLRAKGEDNEKTD
jgi:hypothetical protein